MTEIKKGEKIKLTGFNSFKDNLFRRLIGKLFPSFDRSCDRNGIYTVNGIYSSQENEPKFKGQRGQ